MGQVSIIGELREVILEAERPRGHESRRLKWGLIFWLARGQPHHKNDTDTRIPELFSTKKNSFQTSISIFATMMTISKVQRESKNRHFLHRVEFSTLQIEKRILLLKASVSY